MAFNKKEWMRSYMRRYRRRKRRKPRPGYFDKKAWSRPYMREYMRKRRAKEKVERERNEAINAAIARLSSPAPTAGLSVNDRLAKIDARMAARLTEVGCWSHYLESDFIWSGWRRRPFWPMTSGRRSRIILAFASTLTDATETFDADLAAYGVERRDVRHES